MFRRFPENCEVSLSAHRGPCNNVIFNTTGEYCVTCGSDRAVILWNPYSAKKVFTFSGHAGEVNDIAVNHDNSRIASGGSDRLVLIFDTLKGRPVRHFRGHLHGVNCVCLSRQSTVVLSGSYDKSVRLWDLASSRAGDPIQILEDASDSVTSIFAQDELIVTGCVDGAVRTYDIRKGTLRTDRLGQPVTSVRLTEDRKCVLVSTLDSTIRLVDAADAQILNSFKGHSNSKFRCVSRFYGSKDAGEENVISGSEDGSVVYWGVVNGEVIGKVEGHKGAVRGVDSVDDGLYTVSCCNRGELKLWKRIVR